MINTLLCLRMLLALMLALLVKTRLEYQLEHKEYWLQKRLPLEKRIFKTTEADGIGTSVTGPLYRHDPIWMPMADF